MSSPASHPPSGPSLNWQVREAEPEVCQELERELCVSPVTARLLYNRGVREAGAARRFLSGSWDQMRSPSLFQDMDVAVRRIRNAILNKEKVLIYGDYDVDGVTSIAMLVHFLRRTGLDPLTYIPDRLTEGYGLHVGAMPGFQRLGVRLIVTVDCGISGGDAVREAARHGMDVIVTDHHECSAEIPPALAVLNPKLPGSSFPFRELAGVGVAFYLLVALRAHLRECGSWDADTQPNLLDYLDLVALGTLADMVPLREENRVFVKHGFGVISRTERPGLSMLKEQAGIQGVVSRARPLVFRMIPRINAPGRLGCAQDALDMLLCDDPSQARQMASLVEKRNLQRKTIEENVFREAQRLAREELRERERSTVIVAGEGWHQGILGIVASRIAQEVLRPVVLLSFEAGKGRASVRSVQGLEIMEALLACSHLLDDFGGHQMAAGFSIKRANLAGFRETFEKAIVATGERRGDGFGSLQLDLWLDDPALLNEKWMSELQQLEPFGNGNAEPVFGLKNVRMLNPGVVGGAHLKATLDCGSVRFAAIGFNMGASRFWERNPGSRWNIACSPQVETWRGKSRLNLRFLEVHPA